MTAEHLGDIRRAVEHMERLYEARRINPAKDVLEAYFYAGALRIEVVRELLDEIDQLRETVQALSRDIDYLTGLRTSKS